MSFELNLVKQSFSLILKNPRFLLYPLFILIAAYVFLMVELSLVSSLPSVVDPRAGFVLPWTCKPGPCTELPILNDIIILSIFSITLLIAAMSILMSMTLYLDFNDTLKHKKVGMTEHLKGVLQYKGKILLLALGYSVFIFVLYLVVLSSNKVQFYAPAPIPTYIMLAIVSKKKVKSARRRFEGLSLRLKALLFQLEPKNMAKLAVRFLALTIIPFVFFNLYGQAFITSSSTNIWSLLSFFLIDFARLAPELIVIILAFTLSTVYTFLLYADSSKHKLIKS